MVWLDASWSEAIPNLCIYRMIGWSFLHYIPPLYISSPCPSTFHPSSLPHIKLWISLWVEHCEFIFLHLDGQLRYMCYIMSVETLDLRSNESLISPNFGLNFFLFDFSPKFGLKLSTTNLTFQSKVWIEDSLHSLPSNPKFGLEDK